MRETRSRARVGRWQGQGASWVNPSYDHCASVAQHLPGAGSAPGVQVLDVSDPAHPKLLSSLSGTPLTLPSSALGAEGEFSPDGRTDWCSSPPRFVGRDGLWVTCQDNGLMTLRFTSGAYPVAAAAPCTSRRRFTDRARGRAVVRISGRTAAGRRVAQTRTDRPCRRSAT